MGHETIYIFMNKKEGSGVGGEVACPLLLCIAQNAKKEIAYARDEK